MARRRQTDAQGGQLGCGCRCAAPEHAACRSLELGRHDLVGTGCSQTKVPGTLVVRQVQRGKDRVDLAPLAGGHTAVCRSGKERMRESHIVAMEFHDAGGRGAPDGRPRRDAFRLLQELDGRP